MYNLRQIQAKLSSTDHINSSHEAWRSSSHPWCPYLATVMVCVLTLLSGTGRGGIGNQETEIRVSNERFSMTSTKWRLKARANKNSTKLEYTNKNTWMCLSTYIFIIYCPEQQAQYFLKEDKATALRSARRKQVTIMILHYCITF